MLLVFDVVCLVFLVGVRCRMCVDCDDEQTMKKEMKWKKVFSAFSLNCVLSILLIRCIFVYHKITKHIYTTKTMNPWIFSKGNISFLLPLYDIKQLTTYSRTFYYWHWMRFSFIQFDVAGVSFSGVYSMYLEFWNWKLIVGDQVSVGI